MGGICSVYGNKKGWVYITSSENDAIVYGNSDLRTNDMAVGIFYVIKKMSAEEAKKLQINQAKTVSGTALTIGVITFGIFTGSIGFFGAYCLAFVGFAAKWLSSSKVASQKQLEEGKTLCERINKTWEWDEQNFADKGLSQLLEGGVSMETMGCPIILRCGDTLDFRAALSWVKEKEGSTTRCPLCNATEINNKKVMDITEFTIHRLSQKIIEQMRKNPNNLIETYRDNLTSKTTHEPFEDPYINIDPEDDRYGQTFEKEVVEQRSDWKDAMWLKDRRTKTLSLYLQFKTIIGDIKKIPVEKRLDHFTQIVSKVDDNPGMKLGDGTLLKLLQDKCTENVYVDPIQVTDVNTPYYQEVIERDRLKTGWSHKEVPLMKQLIELHGIITQ